MIEHLTPLERMAAILGAVCHDLDHPGVNQPFLIATANHLATLYKVGANHLATLYKIGRDTAATLYKVGGNHLATLYKVGGQPPGHAVQGRGPTAWPRCTR